MPTETECETKYMQTLPTDMVVCTARDIEENRIPKDLPKWSGKTPIPAIGSKIRVLINGIGEATVVSYFVEYGWLGLHVEAKKVPRWMLKQNGDRRVHVFGIDLA